MNKLNLEWVKAAAIRAAKTFAQTLAAAMTIGAAFEDIYWKQALSVAGVAFIYSIVTSIAGLPEVGSDGELKIKVTDAGKTTYRLELGDELENLALKDKVAFKVIK